MAKNRALATAKRKNELQAYSMIILQVIGFLVLSIYPIVWVFRYSFYDYDGVNAAFCGLDNFVRAFTRDSQYWLALLNTFIIAYGKLIIEIPISFLVALALTSGMVKFKRMFMVGFYVPTVTGIAVSCLIFSFLFSSFNGPVNNILQSIGLTEAPIDWLGAKWTAIIVIIAESIWKGFAINMLYFMAGISGVSTECIEAAKIDGANGFQIFRKITIPLLTPVLRTIIMLAMVNGMKFLEDVMLIANGGPAGSTNVTMLYLYQLYFDAGATDSLPQYGYASALGVITTIIIALITVVYLKVTKKGNSVD